MSICVRRTLLALAVSAAVLVAACEEDDASPAGESGEPGDAGQSDAVASAFDTGPDSAGAEPPDASAGGGAGGGAAPGGGSGGGDDPSGGAGGAEPPVELTHEAYAACAAESANLAACVVAACPNAAPVQVGLAKQLDIGCQGLIANGWLTVDMVAAMGAWTCEQLAVQIDKLIGVNPDTGRDGQLRALCTSGPALEVEICDRGCEATLACDEPVPGADVDTCVFSCFIDDDDAAFFMCAAEADGCVAVRICGRDHLRP